MSPRDLSCCLDKGLISTKPPDPSACLELKARSALLHTSVPVISWSSSLHPELKEAAEAHQFSPATCRCISFRHTTLGLFGLLGFFFLFLKYCRSRISPKGVDAWGNSNTFLPSKQNSSWDGSPLFSIFAEHEWFPGTSCAVGWGADLADLHPPARSPHAGRADGHADGQQSHHSSLSWDSYSQQLLTTSMPFQTGSKYFAVLFFISELPRYSQTHPQ